MMSLSFMLVFENPAIKELLAFLDTLQMKYDAGIRPSPFLPVLSDEVILSRVRVRGWSIIISSTFFYILCFGQTSVRHRSRIGTNIGQTSVSTLLITIIFTDSYDGHFSVSVSVNHLVRLQ